MAKFSVGTRVHKWAGVRLNGVVIPRENWHNATDGTYKAPGPKDVCVKWDDGTWGYCKPEWLKEVQVVSAGDGNEEFLNCATGTFRKFPTCAD